MNAIAKLIVILFITILIISSVLVVYNFENENDNNSDTTAPKIDSVTENTTGTSGKITTISATFSDNINVTEATIFYKSINSNEWSSASILSGSFNIEMPANSDDNWFYYVTVDDAAGNGPVGKPSNDGSKYYIIEISDNVEELVHYAFIEEGTGQSCVYCPAISETIHDLYKSGDYKFYYVSMVEDMNDNPDNLAKQRLYTNYNLFGLPTIFIDGGFEVITGGRPSKEDVDVEKYSEAIRTAEKRNVPKIKITVEIDYENGSSNFTTNVIIKNFEEETYTGRLRVYLTEIISRWNYNVGGQIHHGFLNYILNEDITVEPGNDFTKSKDWDLSNLDPENLLVIGVVFNSESEKKYAYPDGETEAEKKPFDAYFADAANESKVIAGGNLPPQVSITKPVKGYQHIFGTTIYKTLLKVTRLVGATTITVNANDEDGEIEKVEFLIDGELVFTDEEAPYEYQLKKIGPFKSIFFRKHTIKVIAYDDGGKTTTDELEIRARL